MNAVSDIRAPSVVETERPASRLHSARRERAGSRQAEPAMTVSLSADALAAQAADREREAERGELAARLPRAQNRADQAQREADEAMAVQSGEVLSPDEEWYVRDLQARDAEVRNHEAAPVAAAAGHAGTPRYTTEVGPDGRQYAVGGSVSIDLSGAGSPEATADKMRTIKAAASAVSTMSGADMRVASTADRAMHKAQQQAHRKRALRAYGNASHLENAQSSAPESNHPM